MTTQDTLAGRLRVALNLEDEPDTRTNGQSDHRPDGGFEGFEGAKCSPFSWPDPKPMGAGCVHRSVRHQLHASRARTGWRISPNDCNARPICRRNRDSWARSLLVAAPGSSLREPIDGDPKLWAIFIGRPGMLSLRDGRGASR
jgi:hypothetical protein